MSSDKQKTSQATHHKENYQVVHKQSKSSNLKHHVTTNQSTHQYKHQSSSFTNGIDQVIGFIQQKFTRTNHEEKQDFDDLAKIK